MACSLLTEYVYGWDALGKINGKVSTEQMPDTLGCRMAHVEPESALTIDVTC